MGWTGVEELPAKSRFLPAVGMTNEKGMSLQASPSISAAGRTHRHAARSTSAAQRAIALQAFLRSF
jgi:hypothetical protein